MKVVVHLDRIHPTTNMPQKYVIEGDNIVSTHDSGVVYFRNAAGKTLASFQSFTIIGYYSPDAVTEG